MIKKIKLNRKFLFLNQNTAQLAAGMNGSQKNFPEGILRSLLRSSSFVVSIMRGSRKLVIFDQYA
ncbi:hypothetical protein HYW46_05715 [Candidatus Daviesbacteria bacterium]|nr:hypothetical protein [Candidatus Daviesbacteria bacterium]